MPRLFVAARVAPHERLQAILRGLAPVRGVKSVPPANIHYTLRFLGDVALPQAQALRAAFAEGLPQIASFPVTIQGLGAFPDTKRPRVVWAGCDDAAAPRFQALADAVDDLVSPHVPEARDKPFVPHLTLARIKFLDGRGGDAVQALLAEHRNTVFGAQTIDHIHLVESDLTPDGARYTDLAEARLA